MQGLDTLALVKTKLAQPLSLLRTQHPPIDPRDTGRVAGRKLIETHSGKILDHYCE
jgi:hypothetical protein